MRLCQNEQVSLKELAKFIQGDPVMAGRIINMANAVNPNKNRLIASVTTDSLILVGVHSVRQLVLAISLAMSYKTGTCKAFDYGQFWSRSVAMGCAAQALAEGVRIAPVAELFACGLLAGIGRLGLASARPVAYSALLENLAGCTEEQRRAAEMEKFGVDHCSLSALMMKDWSIPVLFRDAVLYHEMPEKSPAEPASRQYRLTLFMQMAAQIADLCIAPEPTEEYLVSPVLALGERLGMARDEVFATITRMSVEWQNWGEILQVNTRTIIFPPPT
jgi:HD-like signal output (HDOD) protein